MENTICFAVTRPTFFLYPLYGYPLYIDKLKVRAVEDLNVIQNLPEK